MEIFSNVRNHDVNTRRKRLVGIMNTKKNHLTLDERHQGLTHHINMSSEGKLHANKKYKHIFSSNYPHDSKNLLV